MAEEALALIIGPALALGVIIGAYEAIIIHRDVTVPTHRFGHMIHAFLLAILFVFCAMNAEFVLSLIPQLAAIPILGTAIGLQIAVGLIAAIKIHGVSKAIKSGVATAGLGETWFHSILIGALIIAAPYAYPAAYRHRAGDDVVEVRRERQAEGRLLKAILLSHRPVRKPASGVDAGDPLCPQDGSGHDPGRPRGRTGTAGTELDVRRRAS